MTKNDDSMRETESDLMRNEPLTQEYYNTQKQLWEEMNSRKIVNNASVLTSEQKGNKNTILSHADSQILLVEMTRIFLNCLLKESR